MSTPLETLQAQRMTMLRATLLALADEWQARAAQSSERTKHHYPESAHVAEALEIAVGSCANQLRIVVRSELGEP